MRLTPLAALAALTLAAIQGLAIGRIELTFDEAYYAMWARWPQWGYFDHPPMVAWWIAGSQALLGGAEFAVRAPFWLAGACLPGLVFWIGRRLYDDSEIAASATLIFVGAPLLAGAPLATPDTPLVFFWTLALLGLVEVWRGTPWAWALVGLAAGAAGLSKLTAGFLGAGIFLALIATPSLRREFARPGPYAAGALTLAVLSPFLWWNAAHGWATFYKQGGRLAARGFAPRYLAEFLGAQALLFNPLSTVAALGGAARGRGAPREPTRLLLATVAPALGYFLIHALHDRVQGNWPAPLYPALALLAGGSLAGLSWLPPISAGLGATAAAALYLHLVTGWPLIGQPDPALRMGGWRDVAARVFAVAQIHDVADVLTSGYAATSLLSIYGVEAVELGEAERWTFRPSVDAAGATLAFGPPDFLEKLRTRFAHVSPLQTVERRVAGRIVETYVIFAVGGKFP